MEPGEMKVKSLIQQWCVYYIWLLIFPNYKTSRYFSKLPESLPRSLPLKAAELRWWTKLEISPKPMLTPCPASGWTLWAASLIIKQSLGVASRAEWERSSPVLSSYPMSASRGRTYSAACPNPRGNSTRLLASTLATLGGSWRAETLVGFRKATACCRMVLAESMNSVWLASLHWVASVKIQSEIPSVTNRVKN